jgi:hypothetical protein
VRHGEIPAGGPWTRHGHEIPGLTVAGSGRPPVARCGGVAVCSTCRRDAERLRLEHRAQHANDGSRLDAGVVFRKRALIDFDGVLHAYSRGWADGTVYDPPVPGAQVGCEHLEADGFEVVIFSTREPWQIEEALERWGWPAYRVTNVKEPAEFLLDDRAVRFTSWAGALAEVHERYVPHAHAGGLAS